MFREVALAVRRVRMFYDFDLRNPNGLEFEKCLFEKLVQKFQNHWYIYTPMRGNAFRSLRWFQGCDSVVAEVAKRTNFALPENRVPWHTTIWIDPKSVSCRIGDNGTTFEIEDEPALLSLMGNPECTVRMCNCHSQSKLDSKALPPSFTPISPETTPTKQPIRPSPSCMLTPPRSPTSEFESVMDSSTSELENAIQSLSYESFMCKPSSPTSSVCSSSSSSPPSSSSSPTNISRMESLQMEDLQRNFHEQLFRCGQPIANNYSRLNNYISAN